MTHLVRIGKTSGTRIILGKSSQTTTGDYAFFPYNQRHRRRRLME